jgi:hypothetical protein
MKKIIELIPVPFYGRAITYESLGGPEIIKIVERLVDRQTRVKFVSVLKLPESTRLTNCYVKSKIASYISR